MNIDVNKTLKILYAFTYLAVIFINKNIKNVLFVFLNLFSNSYENLKI